MEELKTIREAIAFARKRSIEESEHHDLKTPELCHALAVEIPSALDEALAAVSALEEQMRWVPCSERMPEDDTWVLVAWGEVVTIAFCESPGPDGNRFWLQIRDQDCPYIDGITHWKSMPQPPTE